MVVGQPRVFVHNCAYEYGLSVVRETVLARRYVVWVQPSWKSESRYETARRADEYSAWIEAAERLREQIEARLRR